MRANAAEAPSLKVKSFNVTAFAYVEYGRGDTYFIVVTRGITDSHRWFCLQVSREWTTRDSELRDFGDSLGRACCSNGRGEWLVLVAHSRGVRISISI